MVARRLNWQLISGVVFTLIGLAVLQDLLQSTYQNASFYLSESVLFRGVWLLFVPMLFLQQYLLRWSRRIMAADLLVIIVSTGICLLVHAVLFSVIVYGLSLGLFGHTYYPNGTFFYTISEDLSKYLVGYGTAGLYLLIRQNTHPIVTPAYPATLTVGTGQQKTVVKADDILYITASSPYVFLHTPDRKYIHSESLKSIAQKLDPSQFIRIHKSCIINRQKVVSYKSRLNGDYDIRLANNVDVRLSRNYVAAFRAHFL